MNKWYDWRFYVFAISALTCLLTLVSWTPFTKYRRVFVVMVSASLVVLMMYLKAHKIAGP